MSCILETLDAKAIMKKKYRLYLRNIMNFVPNHHNKANTTIKQVAYFFVFPVHVTVMFTPYYPPWKASYDQPI